MYKGNMLKFIENLEAYLKEVGKGHKLSFRCNRYPGEPPNKFTISYYTTPQTYYLNQTIEDTADFEEQIYKFIEKCGENR